MGTSISHVCQSEPADDDENDYDDDDGRLIISIFPSTEKHHFSDLVPSKVIIFFHSYCSFILL